MAYTIDRNEAALRLGVSTRTIDRHIQNERIRTRRIGKKMFLEEDDVEALRLEDSARSEDDYEVIEPTTAKSEILPSNYQKSTEISADAKMALTEFSRIYTDAQGVIAKKDEIIKDLSYKVGKMEAELKNAVDASEFQKAHLLLETTKTQQAEENKNFSEKISGLEREVQKKNSFIVVFAVLFVLAVLAVAVLLFVK